MGSLVGAALGYSTVLVCTVLEAADAGRGESERLGLNGEAARGTGDGEAARGLRCDAEGGAERRRSGASCAARLNPGGEGRGDAERRGEAATSPSRRGRRISSTCKSLMSGDASGGSGNPMVALLELMEREGPGASRPPA